MKNLYQVFNKELAKEYGLIEAVILQMVLDRIEVRARVNSEEPSFDQAVIFTKAEIEDMLGFLNLYDDIKHAIDSLESKKEIEAEYLRADNKPLAAISITVINPERFREYLFMLPDPHDG